MTEPDPTRDYAHEAREQAAEQRATTPDCRCERCQGRGNDGHGLTHCAECCFGTGLIADIDCPIHGEAAIKEAMRRPKKRDPWGDVLTDTEAAAAFKAGQDARRAKDAARPKPPDHYPPDAGSRLD